MSMCRDRGGAIARTIKETNLSLLQHQLALYRKHARIAIDTLRGNWEAPGNMNWIHRWLCRSNRWRTTVERRLPWVLGDGDLGPNVLEIGPGPGLTTEVLRGSLRRVTALEIDPQLAHALHARMKG